MVVAVTAAIVEIEAVATDVPFGFPASLEAAVWFGDREKRFGGGCPAGPPVAQPISFAVAVFTLRFADVTLHCVATE